MRRWIACMCAAMGICGLVSPGFSAVAEGFSVPELTVYRRDLTMNEGLEFVQKMRLGWNLGNTFDAVNDSYRGNDLDIESAWVGVKTSKAMIESVHAAGFNTLRLPVSWHNHVDESFTINEAWLTRVQEVADYALDLGMYVILNTHHDVYPNFYYPDSQHYETSSRYLSRIWEQLSERFRDYDEHLIFESMNEPRLKDTQNEWNYDANVPACVDSMETIVKLNQLFVDTVRASGGNNETRYLMVPSYAAAPYSAVNEAFRLPVDSAENRVIVSAHAYTPYSFALQDGGVSSFNIHSVMQANEIGLFMNALYDTYVKNGIPVVIGEFGARDKNGNTQSRIDFASYYVAMASARGITCCWWDNNAFKGSGELFGIFDRRKLQWPFPEIVEGMVKYAGYDKLEAFPG